MRYEARLVQIWAMVRESDSHVRGLVELDGQINKTGSQPAGSSILATSPAASPSRLSQALAVRSRQFRTASVPFPLPNPPLVRHS